MRPSSAQPPRSVKAYAFGPFRLDADRQRILHDGRAASWRSKRHFELLKVLIDAEPDVVSYAELRDRVWSGKKIEQHTISQTIKDLRERLGIYADCIRNQPGHGYYFDRPPSGSLPTNHVELEVATLLDVAAAEWNRRTTVSLQRALKLYRRAAELDPQCAQAHVGIATCITMGCHMSFAVFPPTELTSARHAAETALSLAKDNRAKAAAMCQVAQLRFMYDWEFEDAERLLDEARGLDDTILPVHQFMSHLYLVTNRWPEAMDAISTARRIAPSSPMIHATAGMMLHFMSRHNEAIEICEAAVSLHPEFARGYGMLGMAYEADRQYDRAIECYEVANEIEEHAVFIAGIGHTCGRTGKRKRARQTLAHLRRLAKTQAVSPYCYALVHAGLGEVEQAVGHLEQAYPERCDWLCHMGVEPRWDGLRSHPRFRRLMKKMKLPDLRRDLSRG